MTCQAISLTFVLVADTLKGSLAGLVCGNARPEIPGSGR